MKSATEQFKENIMRVQRRIQQNSSLEELEQDVHYFFNLKGVNFTLTDLAKIAVDNGHYATLSMLVDMGFNPVSTKVGDLSFLHYVKAKEGDEFSKDLEKRFETAPVVSDMFPTKRKTISVDCHMIKSKLERPDLLSSFAATPYFIKGYVMAFQLGKIGAESIPALLGLQPQDIIIEVNDIRLMTPKDGQDLYQKSIKSDLANSYIKIVRNDKRFWFDINCK
jgi:hypothetical protein